MLVVVDSEFDETLVFDRAKKLLASAELEGLRQTLVKHPRSTIEPRLASVDAEGRRAAEGLALLAAQGLLSGLTLGKLLGEGAMGIVREAEQRSLVRTVAVKTLKNEVTSDGAAALRLLREAWITGRLEHPSVVPIYDLGVDEKGKPLIVMRRVEGASWELLRQDADAVRSRFGAEDLLEWNLRIFLQVTQAISRAHAQGVVHRDLKPDNVMIGSYGEVYLVDWGIAVSLHDDHTGRLPLARDATEAAGTPCYMAPEMLGGPEPRITERTDVYLLGAVLHELITGYPPHDGASFEEMVGSITASSFEFGPEVAPELAAICKRAMQANPERRYPSAAALRKAIEDFLRHRGSNELVSEAAEREAELEASLTQGAEARERIYNLFGACRFGYMEALRSWPENPLAAEGLRRACVRMIAFELKHGSPEAASVILAELDPRPEALVEAVEAALARRSGEKKRLAQLERLERQHDPNIGRRPRLFFGTLLTLAGVVAPLAFGLFDMPESSYATLFGRMGGIFVICVALAFWGRRSLSKTRINRSLTYGILVGFGCQVLLLPGWYWMGLPLEHATTVTLFCWFIVSAILAFSVERRFLVGSVTYLVAFLVSARYPSLRFFVFSFGNLAMLVSVLLAWSEPEDFTRIGAKKIT